MAITIKEFMDYMDNSTETKCKVIEKETNQLLFSGSMWEIPEHYKNRKCTFDLPLEFGEFLTFFVEPFDTTGLSKIVCITHHLDFVEYGDICYFDPTTVYINDYGSITAWLYAQNGKCLGRETLCRFRSVEDDE